MKTLSQLTEEERRFAQTAIFLRAQIDAEQRGIPFNITPQDISLIEKCECPFCIQTFDYSTLVDDGKRIIVGSQLYETLARM